jgi:hypothetical protein
MGIFEILNTSAKYNHAKGREYKNQFFRDEVRVHQPDSDSHNNTLAVVDIFCGAGGLAPKPCVGKAVLRLTL